MSVIRADVPVTPDRQQAQQQAQQELSQGKYHLVPTTPPPPTTASPSPSPTPTPSPTATAAAAHHSSSDLTTLLVIVLIVIFGIVLLLILRKLGKPRREAKDKKAEKDKGTETRKSKAPKHLGAAAERPLTGAALHRHNAEQAARGGDWQEAIRERFRAIIAVLDERALLPERRDRTADEAARDAGLLLPEHAAALYGAAQAFDEVEYGEYLGTPEGYGVISAVDEAVSTRDQAVRR